MVEGGHQLRKLPNPHPLENPRSGQSSSSHNRFNTLLTHSPFIPYQSEPSHSWDTAISKFDIENSRSRSWVRSKMKVTTWVQHSGDSHPFRSMSIEHPIPELWLFQNLNLKIKGQGHGWGHSWKSQCGSNILLTHISFVPCQSALTHSWDTAFSKLDLENLRSSDNDVAQLQV